MFLSRWAAAFVLAGFSLAALSAAPKPPPGEGAPAAKPKLQFEVNITHGGKTTKSPTAAAAITKIQSIQKMIARGAKGPDGAKPAEGAGDFSAVITLNGETKEVSDPAEAEKVCKRINEAMVAARKSGEDLSTLTIPAEDAEALPAAGAEGKGPRRPIRGKNGENGPMPNANNPMNPMNPMNPFAGPQQPIGPFGPGTLPPKQGGNGGGLEGLMQKVPPQLHPFVAQRINAWRQMNNGAFPPPNVIMGIIGDVMQAAQGGNLPPMGQPPVPKQP